MKNVFGTSVVVLCIFCWFVFKTVAKTDGFVFIKNEKSQQKNLASKNELFLATMNKNSSETLMKNVSVTLNKPETETAVNSYNIEKLQNDEPKTYSIGRYEYELAGWLERAHSETQNSEMLLKKKENLVDGTIVFQSLSSDGVRFWQETNAEGAVVAEEFQFLNGSKLSKKYTSTGNMEALFFQESVGYAFSAEYDDANHLVRVIRSVKGKTRVYLPLY